MGDKLGLYRAMAGAGPLTPDELAERTGTAERYVREWLCNQAAGGYVEYGPSTGRYSLPPEQAVHDSRGERRLARAKQDITQREHQAALRLPRIRLQGSQLLL